VAPEALEDHAERALHAALAMRRRLERLCDGSLALRIGVNSGEVVVSRAREGSSFVSGDADELVVQAAACFEAMRLDWRAAQTRALLSGGAALDSRS
jgi:hypothetical protein